MPTHLCDFAWQWDPTPRLARLHYHEADADKQIYLGDNEGTFLGRNYYPTSWFPFRAAYEYQFPFRRHRGSCSYVMLDGHAKAMRIPTSWAANDAQFEADVLSQFEKCTGLKESEWDYNGHGHLCFWNRYGVGIAYTQVDWRW